ncbi:hypothetical protein D3C87_1848450 [compost metagenome]
MPKITVKIKYTDSLARSAKPPHAMERETAAKASWKRKKIEVPAMPPSTILLGLKKASDKPPRREVPSVKIRL